MKAGINGNYLNQKYTIISKEVKNSILLRDSSEYCKVISGCNFCLEMKGCYSIRGAMWCLEKAYGIAFNVIMRCALCKRIYSNYIP